MPEKKEKALVNGAIKFPTVMVIGPSGEKLGCKSTYDALRLATSYELDLLCVAPSAQPPVCKILDYGKYRFEMLKKEKENRKKQKAIIIKELRLSPTIDKHDLEIKVKQTIGWLEEGNKVKIVMRFRGRQITFKDTGEKSMLEFVKLCEEYGTLDKKPDLDGKVMSAFINPKKK